jgi:hypothetical protein
MDDTSIVLLKGRLSGDQKNRLVKLYDMLYTPAEIAEEIGFNKRQFNRVYFMVGCPFEKDTKERIWINGKQFREWIKKTYQKRELGLNEAFCLTCKHEFTMGKTERKKSGNQYYLACICPNCGRKVARYITRGKEIE